MDSQGTEYVTEISSTALLQQLEISRHEGPPVHLPWCYRQESIDEQLRDVALRLQRAKPSFQQEDPFAILPTPPSVPQTTRSKTKVQRMAEREAAKTAEPSKIKTIFIPDADDRYKEMAAFLAMTPEELAARHPDPDHNRTGACSEKPVCASWVANFRVALDMQLTQLKMHFNPEMGEAQLAHAYAWYQANYAVAQRPARRPSSASSSSGLNFLIGDGLDAPRPGSAFYVPFDRDAQEHLEEDAVLDKRVSARDCGLPSRCTDVQLPPAKERLRSFETRQIVSPLTARKLKAACDDSQSPEPRSFTPSTATGGHRSSSARSTPTVLGPMSARSSPTPLGGSRPSSATFKRPMSAIGQRRCDAGIVRPPLSARPGTAPRLNGRPPSLPMSARSPTECYSRSGSFLLREESLKNEAEMLQEALEREVLEREKRIAQQNMEDRWLMRKHRDIASQAIHEERHAAVAIWAERRARVEEEIAYNAESMRFQSELRKRGAVRPVDADEDIPATAPVEGAAFASEALQNAARRQSLNSMGAMAGSSCVHDEEPTRHDVSRVYSDEPQGQGQVRFALDVVEKPKSECHDPRLDRVANLRRIHRHLLKASEAAEDLDIDDGDRDARPMSIFETEVSDQHISLSAYTTDARQDALVVRNKDDSDVVGALCDQWSERHNVDDEACVSFHELRFQQQVEAEAIKRILAKKNIAFNAAAVDSALVMPTHFISPESCIFNKEPNLRTDNLPNWMQERSKPKKKVRAKSKRGKKGRR